MDAHRDAFDKLIGMIGLSSCCLVVLVGVWAYSGSMLPSTEGALSNEVVTIWLFWAALVAVPVLTLCLWVVAVRKAKR
jgi:hypothetical protein